MRINNNILLGSVLSTVIVIAICAISIYNSRKQIKSGQSSIDSLKHTIKLVQADFGNTIHRRDCRTCHVRKGGVDNYFEGVVDRVGEPYLKLYLTNQDSLVKSGDKYAMSLKQAWGNQRNSHNFKYSETELKAIIEYLK